MSAPKFPRGTGHDRDDDEPHDDDGIAWWRACVVPFAFGVFFLLTRFCLNCSWP